MLPSIRDVQARVADHFRPSLRSALAKTISLRMIAVRATLRGFPAWTSCSNFVLADGLCWIALRAGMKRD